MKLMKVLLIWPNSRNEVLGWGDLGAIAEPLALEYLAAGAMLDGHEARILDLRLHSDELDATLATFAPDVVGVTAFSMHARSALALCRRVKELRPACRTVVGGHHASFLPDDFFDPGVDFVVRGEGVRPLRALLASLEAGGAGEKIPAVYAYRDGEWLDGGAPLPFSLDGLPLPDRTATTDDRHRYFIDWMRPVALVRTTVGCPYRCSFCSLWVIMDGRYYKRGIDAVVEEIADLREEFVFLVDDEAFVDGRRMLELARRLRARGVHKRFFAYTRVDTIVRETDALAAWRDVGLERLFVGIDAISSKDLTEYNKRLSVAAVEAALRTARELGLDVFAQFVVNTDYTRRDFNRLARFIEHHDIRYPSFTVLTPLPGTALLDFERIVHRQPNGRPDWDLFDCQNAVTATTLPPDEFRSEYRNLYRVFKGAYTQYREHSHIMDSAAHDGDVGVYTAVRRAATASPAHTR